MVILETERLVIRHFRADDLDEFYEICGDPEILRYVGDGKPLSREQTREWIEKSQANYRKHGFGCSAVVTKEDGRLAGYCGLVNPKSDDVPEAEIIYGFRKEYWGRGLASEAAGAMLRYGFVRCRLKRIIATVDPENHASVRIIEKLGMKFRRRRTDEHGLPELLYETVDAGL